MCVLYSISLFVIELLYCFNFLLAKSIFPSPEQLSKIDLPAGCRNEPFNFDARYAIHSETDNRLIVYRLGNNRHSDFSRLYPV